MVHDINAGRRGFLRRAAVTILGTQVGSLAMPDAAAAAPRELAALGRASEWLNSPRLTASSLAGKVVLVDFWTYTCINWLRTLPYVRAWSQKYRQGLVVIGVHTPEFPFEHNVEEVRRSLKEMDVEYPVVIDNDYAIWRAFDNNYWPALYFIDARGKLRQHQFGEGGYEKSEVTIQRLLAEAGVHGAGDGIVSVRPAGLEAAGDWPNLRSPESYVGYARAEGFAGNRNLDRRHMYTAPARLSLNQWALTGEWTIGKQAVVLGSPNGQIVFRFHARDLHLVMGPPKPAQAVRFRVSIDGQPPRLAHGLDVDEHGNGTLISPRLYQLIRQPTAIVDRTFAIEFLDAGVEAFSFTFG